ncbi:MAG: methyltransferase domain-containing protein [Candidatus Heimdallarchaeota archaeon]
MPKLIKFDYLSKYKLEYLARYRYWIKIIKALLEKNQTSIENILDIGCQYGIFKDLLGKELNLKIIGVDSNKRLINQKRDIYYGYCHKMPFENHNFDFITLISVFEHIHPTIHEESIKEINRVLKLNGLLFVQIPNPKFPIEFHSRLPFFGYLPESVQLKYLKLFRKERSFWSIDLKLFTNLAIKNGFEVLEVENYAYPKDVVPKKFRPFYFITRFFPMGYYSLYIKKVDFQ